jgi:hypothetical protein
MNQNLDFLIQMLAGYSLYEFVLRRYRRLDKRSLRVQTAWLSIILFAATSRFLSPATSICLIIAVVLYVSLTVVFNRKGVVKKERMLELFVGKNVLLMSSVLMSFTLVGSAEPSFGFDRLWNYFFNGYQVSIVRMALYSIGFAFITDGGTVIVRGVLNKFPTLQRKALAAVRSKGKTEAPEYETSEEERTGELLGILERWLILVFVLNHNFEAVAFVLAAKSVARFSALDDKDFAEYYLLGTLASVGIAVVTGIVINSVLLP